MEMLVKTIDYIKIIETAALNDQYIADFKAKATVFSYQFPK